jgi:hypothetical protein
MGNKSKDKRLRGLAATEWATTICPDHPALFFQILDINWTGMTNLLDIPGLRY